MEQNNKKRKIPDFEINYDDHYLIRAVDGEFTELRIGMKAYESLLDFFEMVVRRDKGLLTDLIKKMQTEGVRIEDISVRLIPKLKNNSFGPDYEMACMDSMSLWTRCMSLKYERRYGISRGLFELAKRIKIEYPRYNLRPAVREELLRMLPKCRTRRDLTRALKFETLADDSPVLRYILLRSRQ